ncbi:MAG TPA: FAD-dependent oxidoreductase [Candidatus Limnocylindria bacterium]|nr:FAD-dependent oxidoreductase [Candidatus Limnocylindria bacterium]
MSDIRSVVIVGGGLAGANAAFALRERGFEGSVTLIGDERQLPYERPPMSKEYLRREKTLEQTYVKPAGQYAENDITLVSGKQAVEIRPTDRMVVLGDGSELGYDALVLATGSEPRPLDAPGADLNGVYYLRNVDDADRIRAAADAATSIAVIGGGWIGTEVAASLRQLGRNVTLISLPPQPLEHVLGSEVAAIYRKLHEEKGTTLVVGRVARLVGDAAGRVRSVQLADGGSISADMVVAGVGSSPRVDLARTAGLKLRDGGIEVDEYLESSMPGIYAIGDVATSWNPRFGRFIRVEHWDNAIEQGKAVAANIHGEPQAYERTPYFYSDQFDLGMEYRGLARGFDRVVIRGDADAREFDAFWLKDGHVVAAMNANRWDDAAELQDLVDRQAVVDPDELARDKAPATAG